MLNWRPYIIAHQCRIVMITIVFSLLQKLPFSILNISHISPPCSFSKNCHTSTSIPKVSQRLKQRVTLSGLIAYYAKQIAPSLLIASDGSSSFLFFFFLFAMVCQRQHQRSGVWLEWLHPGNTLASATVHGLCVSSLWSSLLSLHDPSAAHSSNSLTHLRVERGGAELILTCLSALFLTTAQPSFFPELGMEVFKS